MYPQHEESAIDGRREVACLGKSGRLVARPRVLKARAEVVNDDGAVACILWEGLLVGLAGVGALPLRGEEGKVEARMQVEPGGSAAFHNRRKIGHTD